MNQNTENKKCQICNGYLFDEDDIVICPICGAPHHKDCWQTIGHCGLEHAHGTEQQYDKQNSATENIGDNSSHTCKFCGRISHSKNASFCPYCGHAFNNEHTFNSGMFINGIPIGIGNNLGGISKDSELDGVKASEMATFVGASAHRYIPKFFKLSKKNRGSWNWTAFFFPGVWNLSRKMYSDGILYLILLLASSLCFIPFNQELYHFYTDGMTEQELFFFIQENLSSFSVLSIIMVFIGALLNLIPRIINARLADWNYRCFALEKIKKIKANPEISDINAALLKSGSVSLFLIIIGFLAQQYLPLLIQMFIP